MRRRLGEVVIERQPEEPSAHVLGHGERRGGRTPGNGEVCSDIVDDGVDRGFLEKPHRAVARASSPAITWRVMVRLASEGTIGRRRSPALERSKAARYIPRRGADRAARPAPPAGRRESGRISFIHVTRADVDPGVTIDLAAEELLTVRPAVTQETPARRYHRR